MRFTLRITLTVCLLLSTAFTPQAQTSTSDSLLKVLSHTVVPRERIGLLLNLKDLNEETNLNLPYSIRLFREAAAAGDTYAMTVAVVPIVTRYAAYTEKQDSLYYYIATLRKLTPGTPHEGMDEYAQLNIAFKRLDNEYNHDNRLRMAHETICWCDSLDRTAGNIYRQTKSLVSRGYAQLTIDFYEKGVNKAYIPQTGLWERAYRLTQQMPDLSVRRNFAALTYYLLSGAYNQAHRYPELVKLTDDFIALLDAYYTEERQRGRRPYLYADNSYVRPYKQLLRGALNIGRNDLAEHHFQDFSNRMLAAEGKDLLRNKTYLYEFGYLWHGLDGDFTRSIQYSDSLIRMIETGQGYFHMNPGKIRQVYRDRSRLLFNAGRHDEALKSYCRTTEVLDSILAAENRERTKTIRLRHEMDRLKLSETQEVIRNRATALFAFSTLGVLLLATAGYLYRTLRRNRKLQADILRHSRKAQESDRMKSTFVDTICRGVEAPLEELGQATRKLMIAGINAPERAPLLEHIRENTDILLSTLDNLLEAANLDSLTEPLHLELSDIDELCRAEVLAASQLRHNPQVSYTIDTPGTQCLVRTHAKYFSFVVRALLDNAGKFTDKGSISLRYELLATHNKLRITVSDTGCGISPEKRSRIFRPLGDDSPASRGLSLALCRLIAEHLEGSIRLDESYTTGTRFIFTIPIKS